MKNIKNIQISVLCLLLLFLTGCGPAFLKKLLKDHPEIVTESIKNNPVKYMEALTEAQRKYIQEKRKMQQKQELSKQEEEFKNPKKPSTPGSRVYFGNKKAPITIVEYSDFQCGYCSRAVGTMKQILKAYPKEVRVLYKHFPVTGSPQSIPAAQYYEAIGRQDAKKAHAFHDKVFERQSDVRSGGKKVLKEIAKSLKVNIVRLEKDLIKTESTIADDRKEAVKFGFSGTPGFLVGGITVPGAVPYSYFKNIIDRHLGKVAPPKAKKELKKPQKEKPKESK